MAAKKTRKAVRKGIKSNTIHCITIGYDQAKEDFLNTRIFTRRGGFVCKNASIGPKKSFIFNVSGRAFGRIFTLVCGFYSMLFDARQHDGKDPPLLFYYLDLHFCIFQLIAHYQQFDRLRGETLLLARFDSIGEMQCLGISGEHNGLDVCLDIRLR